MTGVALAASPFESLVAAIGFSAVVADAAGRALCPPLLAAGKSVISGTAAGSAVCAMAVVDAVCELATETGVEAIGESGIDEPAAASLGGDAGEEALCVAVPFAGAARLNRAPTFVAPVTGDGLPGVTGVNVVAPG